MIPGLTVGNLTITHAMCCDDVRREDNGKLLIIGVYLDDVRVSSFPNLIVVRTLVFSRSSPGIAPHVAFRAMLNDEQVMAVDYKPEPDAVLEPDRQFMFDLPQIHLQTVHPSVLSVEVSEFGREWTSILRLPIASTDNL